MKYTGKTLLDYFQMKQKSSNENYIQHSSILKQKYNHRKSTISKMKLRAENCFHNCIVIDDDNDNMMNKSEDDDIQEIQRQK